MNWQRPWHRSTRPVVAEVARITGVSPLAIQSCARGDEIMRARGICWLVMREAGLTYDHITDLCDGMSFPMIAYAVDTATAADKRLAEQVAVTVGDVASNKAGKAIVEAVSRALRVDPWRVRSHTTAPYKGPVAKARRAAAVALVERLGNASLAGRIMGRAPAWAERKVEGATQEEKEIARAALAALDRAKEIAA